MEPKLPWYIAGPLIGLIVPALLILREKQFGMSSSFSYLLGVLFPKKEYFHGAKKNANWQFHFGLGLIASAFVSFQLFTPNELIIPELQKHGAYLVESVYENDNLIIFLIAGLLVGFGARFANGCTAGNCIMGVSQFSISSIIATVAFFISGVITAQFINPLIF